MEDLFYIVEDANISLYRYDALGITKSNKKITDEFANIIGKNNDYIKSTCKVYGLEQIDLTKRNSTVHKDKFIISSQELNHFFNWFNHSLLKIDDDELLSQFELLKFELLKYYFLFFSIKFILSWLPLYNQSKKLLISGLLYLTSCSVLSFVRDFIE
jgi:hypothetical protein